jgi:hypothetical protein
MRGQLAVQFYEKRPRKASWFTKAEEKVCWEQWSLNVTIISPRTEAGAFPWKANGSLGVAAAGYYGGAG